MNDQPKTLDRTTPPAPGPIRPFAFPSVDRSHLDNGLELVVARHGELPIVTAELVLDAGAVHESDGRGGLARLTVDALETGTRDRSADEIAWALESLGVELRAQAGWDAAVLRVTVPGARLEPALELVSELVRAPAFPEPEVTRLRDEQLADILQRRKDPGALASDAASRFIFRADVPYARPIIGTRESVERISRADLERFHAERYVPNAGALLLVGDVEMGRARVLAASYFADWAQGTHGREDFEVAPRVSRTTVFVVDRPGAVQSEIRIGDVGVERHHADYFRLLVMNTILGGAFTSRLNLSLRERHGFTYGAHSSFAFRRRPGPFTVQAAVATDVTARAVQEALREMTALQDDGATEDEVASARDYLTGIIPLQLQTTSQLAARLADLVIYELPDDYFQHYRDRIAAVTPEDVREVARRHLRLDRLAVVVVGDAQAIAPQLEEILPGAVEVQTPT